MTLDIVASQFEEGFRRTSRFYAASNVWDCCDLALRSIEGTYVEEDQARPRPSRHQRLLALRGVGGNDPHKQPRHTGANRQYCS